MGKDARFDRLEEAARLLQVGENRANFVSDVGSLLGQGALTSEQLKALRLALTEADLESAEQRGYALALRDVLRSAEATRREQERVASVDRVLEGADNAKVLVALAKGPAGPSELAAALGKGQAHVSRLLGPLEEAGLVSVIEGADGRARRRELTPRGHHAARKAAEQRPGRSAQANVESIVEAVVDALGAVFAFPSVRVSELTSMARRFLSPPLAKRVAAALPRAGETAGLLDSNKEEVRWGALQEEHLALLAILRERPQQWNEAIERVVGGAAFVMVVRNQDRWRWAFNKDPGMRPPADIQSPKQFVSMEEDEGIVIFDDLSVAEQHGGKASRSYVASAKGDQFQLVLQ